MDLPLHTKQRGGGTVQKLQSAFDKTATLAGLRPTKAGSGDKEKAFIVRQNFVMKTVLILFIACGAGLFLLFSTVLKVSVTKRTAIESERVHHLLEHQANVKLMRAHIELQKALEHEVHETNRMEEFRSSADQILGSGIIQVQDILKKSSLSPDVIAEVDKVQEVMRTKLIGSLMGIIVHFQTVSRKAKQDLKKVAHAIVSDVELDKKEDDRFKTKMMHDFKIDTQSKNQPSNRNVEDSDQYGLFNDETDAEVEDDDNEIAAELENFFKKLTDHDYPLLTGEVIETWEKDMAEIQKMMDDNSKDTDMDKIKSRVHQNIGLHAPAVAKFNDESGSIIDYYEMQIEQAKLAFHKQELLDLYNGWKTDGQLSPLTVLAGLEKVAEENSMYLLYEWLEGNEADVN